MVAERNPVTDIKKQIPIAYYKAMVYNDNTSDKRICVYENSSCCSRWIQKFI